MLRYVIVGTGHSGTGYVAQLLTRAGVPCGHEQIFWANGFVNDAVAGLAADSSWAATYHLSHPIVRAARLVHAIRHPLRVLESWALKPTSDLFYGPTSFRESIDNPALRGWEKLANRYMVMTRHVRVHGPAAPLAGHISVVTVRVEDGPALLDKLDLPCCAEIDRTYNSHRTGKQLTLTWDELPRSVACDWVRRFAEGWGYE